MPVKLFKCALPITKGLCFSAHLLRSWFLPSMLQDLLQYACPAGLLLSRCWSSPSPLQRHSLEVLHEISPCHGHSASVLTCTCGVCSFFFPDRNSTRKWPRGSQCSDQLRAEQLRPCGSRWLSSLPEHGCSSWGLGRYLSCGFILHKVVFHLSAFCNRSRVFKRLWNAVESLLWVERVACGAGWWEVELVTWSWLWLSTAAGEQGCDGDAPFSLWRPDQEPLSTKTQEDVCWSLSSP